MKEKFKQSGQYVSLKWAVAGLLLALVLYVLGIKFVLPLVLILVNVLYLPVPKIFRSFVGRLTIGLLMIMSLVQVASTIQFLTFPTSNFTMLASLTVALQLLLLVIAPREQTQNARFISKTELCSLAVILLFVLPFTQIFLGQNTFYRIGEIGGIQAIDGTNHFADIAEMIQSQHLTYAVGNYYPKGFHITVGFIENAFIGTQVSLGWRGNALLYFADYIVLGSLLAYVLYLFAAMLLDKCFPDVSTNNGPKWLLAFCLAPVAVAFFLLPFINEGFLNYYYVCATIIAGMICLLSLKDEAVDDATLMVKDATSRWLLAMYLMLIFGASVSWPLLIPPLLLIGFILVVARVRPVRTFILSFLNPKGWPIVLLFLMQLVPIYFQLKYSGTDASQGINQTGGLKAFHPFVLLGGVAIVIACAFSKWISDSAKRLLLSIFLPMIIFIGVLVLVQYFSVGEIRYYVIKSSMLLEMLLLALSVALFTGLAFSQKALVAVKYLVFMPIIPFVATLLLIGPLDNPLKDVRDIFRNRSGEAKPDFFDQDLSLATKLGSGGLIRHANLITLHYNQTNGFFYSHVQLPFWVSDMQYLGDKTDQNALSCEGNLYGNLDFTPASSAEQRTMIAKLQQCVQMAKTNGVQYYIVTDAASVPYIHQTFGNIVTLVY